MRPECREFCPILAELIEDNATPLPLNTMLTEGHIRDLIADRNWEELALELEPADLQWFFQFMKDAEDCVGPTDLLVPVVKGFWRWKKVVHELHELCGLESEP